MSTNTPFPTRGSIYYEAVEGIYVLHTPFADPYPCGEEIALLFDFLSKSEIPRDPVILKHGPVNAVLAYRNTAAKAYMRAGFPAMIDSWVMYEGKLDVDEVNRALATTGYVPAFLRTKESR